MESIVGHRIDGNKGRGSERPVAHTQQKLTQVPPPRGGALTICTEIWVKNFGEMVPVFFLAPETGTGLSYTI